MDNLESAVLNTARYLKHVRPIDPGEVTAYVEEPVTETDIRNVLREYALDLELVERSDGCFVPVGDEPISIQYEHLNRLPDELVSTIDTVFAKEFGPEWPLGDSGEQLRSRITRLKAGYLDEVSASYDRIDAYAYCLYHFPRSYAATWYVLSELAESGLLPRHLSVLDVGAGTGSHMAAIGDLLPRDTLISYTAVEPSPLIDLARALYDQYTPVNLHTQWEQAPIEAIELEESYDLVLLGNVLSELQEPVSVAERTFAAVSESGAWVALSPADPRTSIQLRNIERHLAPPATIFSPTLRLWPNGIPTDDCWSFVEQQPLAPISFQRDLQSPAPAEERRAFENRSVRYSYTILRNDGRKRYDVVPDKGRFSPLASVGSVVGKRINVLVVKLSHDLAQTGNPLYRIGDGSQQESCFAVAVTESILTETLKTAPYGAVLSIEQALVLWNDDEGAYNLVVDDETIVDQVRP